MNYHETSAKRRGGVVSKLKSILERNCHVSYKKKDTYNRNAVFHFKECLSKHNNKGMNIIMSF